MPPASIDDKIAAWHDGDGEGLELHEYLGWTWEAYCHWVNTGEVGGQRGHSL